MTDSLPYKTEGIKYAGSKLKLLPYILDNVQTFSPKTVLDGFAGTTRVSQALSQSGYITICNDLSIWSEIFGKAYLLNKKKPEDYADLIKHLNNVKPYAGWFTEQYGGKVSGASSIQKDGKKRIWQEQNTKKLDAIRDEIDKLKLTGVEKAVALSALLLALDKVDSTVGHQVSYLKEWASRSYNLLRLEVPNLPVNTHENFVYEADIFDLLNNPKTPNYDLAYYDPPYGSNNVKMPASRVRYQSYYHIWKTIILNDKPTLFGEASRREDSRDTAFNNPFEDFRINPETNKHVSMEIIGKMLKETNCETILLSYATDGKEMLEELQDQILSAGKLLKTVEIDYKRHVMSSMRWTNEWVSEIEKQNKELIFIIKK